VGLGCYAKKSAAAKRPRNFVSSAAVFLEEQNHWISIKLQKKRFMSLLAQLIDGCAGGPREAATIGTGPSGEPFSREW
jgi:hypothetical protein